MLPVLQGHFEGIVGFRRRLKRNSSERTLWTLVDGAEIVVVDVDPASISTGVSGEMEYFNQINSPQTTPSRPLCGCLNGHAVSRAVVAVIQKLVS